MAEMGRVYHEFFPVDPPGCHSAALRPVNDSEENQGFPPKPPFLTGFPP
jgi:hypothetical protein